VDFTGGGFVGLGEEKSELTPRSRTPHETLLRGSPGRQAQLGSRKGAGGGLKRGAGDNCCRRGNRIVGKRPAKVTHPLRRAGNSLQMSEEASIGDQKEKKNPLGAEDQDEKG